MSEFVVYTGPVANHDSRTRKMIRSKAMRDFRRRERMRNINTFRDHGTDLDTGTPKKRYHRDQQHRFTKQEALVETDQPFTLSHLTAKDDISTGLGDITGPPEPPITSFHDPSAAFGPTLLNLDLPTGCDGFASDSALAGAAWRSAEHAVLSKPHTPNYSDLLKQRPTIPSAVVASRSISSVKNERHHVAAPRPTRNHYFCASCLWQAATCSICNITETGGQRNTQNHSTILSDHHYTEDKGIIGNPMYSISSLSSHDPHEQRALQYFQFVVAKDVSGTISIGFWEQLVPQMCQMEDTARQVAVALSQAHLERATVILSSQDIQGSSGFTLSAETELRASRTLRKYIESSRSPSYELVLTCSIMFHTIESMSGRETSARLHLENALKMFKAWQKARKQARPKGSLTAFRSLAIALARLDASCSIEDDKRIPVFEHDDHLPATMSCEAIVASLRFASPHEAHYQLIRVSTPACAFVLIYPQWHGKYARHMPRHIVEEQQLHRQRFRAWNIVMNIYESDRMCDKKSNNRRDEAMSLLSTRIVHWCAEKVVEEFVRNDDDINPWDVTYPKLFTFTSELKDNMEEARLSDGHFSHTSFSPEIAACGFLLLLAHRTALPHIRAEALELAQKFDRKEGARDLCGAFIRWTQLPYPRPDFPFLGGQPGH